MYPKILDLTIISEPNGYIAWAVYGINQSKYYFCVLLMVKLLIITQFLIKREPTCPYILKIWNNYIWRLPQGRGNHFCSINWGLFIFRACSWHYSSSASKSWSKETYLDYFLTIPTPNQYRERAQGNGLT